MAVAAVAVGLASVHVAFDWDQPVRWLPDLVVGLTLASSGLAARNRSRGVAVLLVLAGFAWFAANITSDALYWHRGPLVHVLVAYPGWRPRSRFELAAVAAGYAASLAPFWHGDLPNAAFAVALVAVVAIARGGAATRRHRRTALRAASAVAVVLIGGTLARFAVPGGDAALAALIAYETVLCLVAVGLVIGLRERSAPAITDLVIELGQSPSGILRDALARVLADPSLRVGYWSADAREYLDANGNAVTLPRDGGAQSATYVSRDGGPFAVLVHDRSVLDDPALAEAVATATRLAASHAALQADVRTQIDELVASRRRLVIAGDEQRRDLERRLRTRPGWRLSRLRDEIVRLRGRADDPHLARALDQVRGTLADLDGLARGLHPRELADGLAVALAGLAERSPLPVRLSVTNDHLPAEIEVAVWYTCAEAVTNAVKHAGATGVTVDVRQRDGTLVVQVDDDGCGGADPGAGAGLRGLADRVEALGGHLTVISAAGRGTRVATEIPIRQG